MTSIALCDALPPLVPTGRAPLHAHVLVVSDAFAKQNTVPVALRSGGYDVVEVTSARAALESAIAAPPDAVVLGLSIAERECIELCRQLKSASESLLPVLYLSSRTSREARARALDAGFDVYLAHPFDHHELCAAVGALIRLKRGEADRVAAAGMRISLNDALDALSKPVALLGADSVILAVNRAWLKFGAENGGDADACGSSVNYCELCERAEGACSEEAFAAGVGIRNVLVGNIPSFELAYPCHSPTQERWFRLVVQRVDGRGPAAAIVMHVDHTREHAATSGEALAMVEADADRRRLEATLEALPVGVWIASASGRLTHTNSAAVSTWGGAAPLSESIDEYSVYRGWSSETGEELEPEDWTLARTLRTGKSFQDFVEIQRFDGTRGHIINSSAPIRDAENNLIGGVVVAVDISDRQEVVRERDLLVASLERERSRLVMIFDHAPSFLAVLSGADYVFERCNPAYLEVVGQRDPIGKPLAEALPEVIGQGFVDLLDSVRASGEPFIGRQVPVQLSRTPGAPLETRYLDLVYQRIVDDEGEYSIVSHGNDITESVMATEALLRAQRQLRDQFEKLPVPTYLWELRDDDFVLLESNEAAVRSSPAHGAQAIGRPSRELFPGMDAVRLELIRSLRDNVVVRTTAEFDGGKHGKRTVELTIGPQQPDRVLVHAVDTTARIELESQLRQAQKMDADGRLAGGVAHDFNNLLTVIGAHAAFLMESLGSDDTLRADAEEIQKAGIRAAGLTRQLLAFSRKQILKPTVIDLNAIVVETGQMLTRLLGEDIDIVTHLAPELHSVVADASQIAQVVMNLAVNARDAMPDGGVLTIVSRNIAVDATTTGAAARVTPGDYAMIEISDTGIGMDATVQARLFEPFFTTKEPGKGTGLGLATVYGIVKQSSGFVLVDSTPGKGTIFRIYLPTVTDTDVLEELRGAEDASVRGVETILLVEDEPAVREIAKRILVRKGYVVLVASNGAEALALSSTFDSAIHLVISDSVMPGKRGAEVVRRLQEQRPALKALFMSGYTDDEILRRGIVSSTAAFIQKPFSLVDFSRAVRDALDR